MKKLGIALGGGGAKGVAHVLVQAEPARERLKVELEKLLD